MKSILICVVCTFCCIICNAQQKPAEKINQDTVLSITIGLADFRELLTAIDYNIDSKKASSWIISFLQQNAKLVQPIQPPVDYKKIAKEATKETDSTLLKRKNK